MKKQISLDFADLRFLEIGCHKCSTKVTLDATAGSRTPGKCPSCNTEFDHDSIQGPIQDFMSAYRTMTHAEQKFKFRVLIDEDLGSKF